MKITESSLRQLIRTILLSENDKLIQKQTDDVKNAIEDLSNSLDDQKDKALSDAVKDGVENDEEQ
tara:strand:- start:618 stop:812 length:195 start_codon:yes stop_codon:yes gene_type:complete